MNDITIHVLGTEALVNDPEGVVGWLQANTPTLFNFLLLSDELWSDIIFQDKQVHTISWHIAMRAKGGDLIAKMACEALNLLSPDHCAHALAGGV